MINYGKQLIDKNDINEVASALESDWLTQGERVEKFEKDLDLSDTSSKTNEKEIGNIEK